MRPTQTKQLFDLLSETVSAAEANKAISDFYRAEIEGGKNEVEAANATLAYIRSPDSTKMETTLFLAAQLGCNDVVTTLIDNFYQVALIAKGSAAEAAKETIDYMNQANNNKLDPIKIAVAKCHPQVVNSLVDNFNKMTSIQEADEVKTAKKTMDYIGQTFHGVTLLYLAAQTGSTEVVETLLTNFKDKALESGMTDTDAAKATLDYMKKVSSNGATALHKATEKKCAKFISKLIEKFRMLAEESGMSRVKAAEATMSYMTQASNDPATPLNLAIRSGDELIVAELIANFRMLAVAGIDNNLIVRHLLLNRVTPEAMLKKQITSFCQLDEGENEGKYFDSIRFLYEESKTKPKPKYHPLLIDYALPNVQTEEDPAKNFVIDPRILSLLIAYNNKLINYNSNPDSEIRASHLIRMLGEGMNESQRVKMALFATIIREDYPIEQRSKALDFLLTQEKILSDCAAKKLSSPEEFKEAAEHKSTEEEMKSYAFDSKFGTLSLELSREIISKKLSGKELTEDESKLYEEAREEFASKAPSIPTSSPRAPWGLSIKTRRLQIC